MLAGYGRGSKDEQVLTLAVQTEKCKAFHASRVALGEESQPFGGMIVDSGISGGMALFDRPAGNQILINLKAGDGLIVTTLDRAFRDTLDCCVVYNILEERGIQLYILDMPFDLNTPVGKLMMQVMAVFAEFERKKIMVRTKDALRHKKKQGKPVNQESPAGWKKVGKKSESKFVHDEKHRRLFDEYIVPLRDKEKFTFYGIYEVLRKRGIRNIKDKEWTENAIRCNYWAAKSEWAKVPLYDQKELRRIAFSLSDENRDGRSHAPVFPPS